MKTKLALFALLVLAALPAWPQERWRTLHDAYCQMCHDTQVYTRKDRLAANYAEIRAQVDRWQGNASLNWSAADIDLVSSYLARKFYKTDCPAAC
jgi:hypothetical protein